MSIQHVTNLNSPIERLVFHTGRMAISGPFQLQTQCSDIIQNISTVSTSNYLEYSSEWLAFDMQRQIGLWNCHTGKRSYLKNVLPISTISWNRNDHILAAASDMSNMVHVWNAETKLKVNVEVSCENVIDLQYQPRGDLMREMD